MTPEFQGLPKGFFSMMLNTPQTFCSAHTRLKADISGPDNVLKMEVSMLIDRPWMQYSGNRIRDVDG